MASTDPLVSSSSIFGPSVSGILLCYNCQAFIAEALQSALKQDCAPMQLIVSDDASTDDTVGIVQAILDTYEGPHKIEFQRRSNNSGSKSAHLNHVFPHAQGDIIISFDGDDISEPYRVRKIVGAFAANARVYAVYSSFTIIDESGRRCGVAEGTHPQANERASAWFAKADAYAAGTTLAIRREVVEQFGDLDPQIHEDIVLPFRASLLGDVAYLQEPLVKARRHSASLTADHSVFESLKRYRERIEWGIERAKRHQASRFSDLRTAIMLMPDRTEELRALESVVLSSINSAELSAGIVSDSFIVRLKTLLRLWQTGAYPEERTRQVSLAFAPRLYLWYKRRALRVRKHTLQTTKLGDEQ